MPSNLVKLTFQAVLLSCLSNVLAQIIGCYKAQVFHLPCHAKCLRIERSSQKSLTLDLVSLFQFVLFTVISCPPNILWQQFLEDRFPAYTFRKAPKVKADDDQVKSGEMGLDVPNTCKKFALDQTIGAAFNTVMFIVAIGLLKGKDLGTVTGDCQRVSCQWLHSLIQDLSCFDAITNLLTDITITGLLAHYQIRYEVMAISLHIMLYSCPA